MITRITYFTLGMRNVASLKRNIISPIALRCNVNRKMSNKTISQNDFDKPIKYSESKAATWKAEYTRNPNYDSVAPACQRYVVAFSLIIFMIYFFILREENDIDKIFERELAFYAPDDWKVRQNK